MSSTDEQVARARALVIDDDVTTRMLATKALEKSGVQVFEAADGAAALELLASTLVDVVLLDVEMPLIDGFTVCTQIRADERTAELPVIMMTGRGDIESIQRAYAVGATDFVPKPINWLIVGERIDYVLRASTAFSELARQKEKLAESQRIARLGNWELNLRTLTISGSVEFRRLYGLEHFVVITFDDLLATFPEDDAAALRFAVEEGEVRRKGFALDHRLRLDDGSEHVVHVQSRYIEGDALDDASLEGIAQDVTERRRADEQIRYMAFHDSLTGLGNHRLLTERLGNMLRSAERHERTTALLFLGIEDFDRMRDTLGPSSADTLIELVASRLVGSIRFGDSVMQTGQHEAESTVSRLGGDEFALLLGEIRDAHDAARVAKRVIESCTEPFSVDGLNVALGVSLGIAIAPLDGDEAESLIRNAGAAMHHARRAGRNRYEFYNQSINETAERRLTLELALRDALREDRLSVQYQPKLGFESAVIEGMETLVRWQDATLGAVAPDEFIPLAEETGLIGALSSWIMKTACAQVKLWHAAGYSDLRVAVNVSATDIADPGLPGRVAEALACVGLDPGFLELEITETALITKEKTCRLVLDQLKEIGVQIALDDFGTGYSSLSLLRRFPVDAIKIDRSFISEVESSTGDAGIVTAIVSMAKALDLRIVAEGVETEGQHAFLSTLGCDEEQGYRFSRPLDPDAFLVLLAGTNRSAGPA